MTDRRYVLDASALLCLLFDEPGAETVEGVLHGALISAANYAEVIGKLIDKGQDPDEAIADLTELDLDVVPLDRAQSEIAGSFRRQTRQVGLSLGDRACLALAKSSSRTAITADRIWAQVAQSIAVEVEVIR